MTEINTLIYTWDGKAISWSLRHCLSTMCFVLLWICY